MCKALSFLLILFLMASALNGTAQRLRKKFSMGFSLEAGTTTGDVKDVYGLNAGMSLRGSYRAGPGFATLSSGLIVYAPKKLSSPDAGAGVQLPVKAGYKFLFDRHFFVMGELGYSWFRTYFNDGLLSQSHTDAGGWTYAPSVGIQFGVLEMAILYEAFKVETITVGRGAIRIGFNF